MSRSVPCILSIRTDSFRVFSVYEQIHSVCSQYKKQLNFVRRFTSFRLVFVFVQILSAYSHYTKRYILHIFSIHTDSFRVFEECAQIILNFGMELFLLQLLKGHYFKKSMYVCNWTKDLQGIIYYLPPCLTKKISFCIFSLYPEWLWICISLWLRIYIRK